MIKIHTVELNYADVIRCMLYGNNVLVLFYKNFTTAYSYTKLGYIDNSAGLATALNNGNVVVKFEKN